MKREIEINSTEFILFFHFEFHPLQNSGTASTLTVEKCDVGDAGNYTCVLGEEKASLRVCEIFPMIKLTRKQLAFTFVVRLFCEEMKTKFDNSIIKVIMYPIFEPVEKQKNQVQGDPLTLTCKARGSPTPILKWTKGK